MIIVVAGLLACAVQAQTSRPTRHEVVAGEGHPATQPAGDGAKSNPGEGSLENLSVTEHEVKVGEGTLKYRATAGTMAMKDEAGKAKASVFFVAYEKIAAEAIAPEKRPITYLFNGGPGAAAVWLHMGAAGPRRVALSEQGEPPAPPYKLVDNDQTWLDLSDLVFIDPVGTGFSRPAQGEAKEQFFGVEEDVRWVADFIRLYTTKYERWTSPKFLAGESYGTTRAAALADYLPSRYGIDLNGIILISTVLNFGAIQPSEGNDLPFVLYLPTYTATAWYHKKLPADLQADLKKAMDEARQWSLGEYTAALAKGNSLSGDERKAVVQKLSRYTGLTAEYIEKANLRISPGGFQKTLLADQRLVVGRFDGRLTAFDVHPLSGYPEEDPSLCAISGRIVRRLMTMCAGRLGIRPS